MWIYLTDREAKYIVGKAGHDKKLAGIRKKIKEFRVDDDWRDALIERAREQYASQFSNDVEVDDGAVLSRTDSGDWVQAWVWLKKLDDDEAAQ